MSDTEKAWLWTDEFNIYEWTMMQNSWRRARVNEGSAVVSDPDKYTWRTMTNA